MPLPRLRPSRPVPAAPPCPQRGGGRPCAPLNRIWLVDDGGRLERAYAGCSCGERFGIGEARDRWRHHRAAAQPALSAAREGALAGPALSAALAGVPAADRIVRHAAPGVVPVGHPVIHQPAAWVDHRDPQVAPFGDHMLAVMDAAPGIGLAANQVGAGIRVTALNFPRLIPQVWVNPVLLDSSGEWTYPEGCLSLVVEDSHVDVVRPRHVTVVADLPGGGGVVVEADELLARVIQHELDHLEGIEYVQRLEGADRAAVDDLLTAEGIDPDLLPPRPYG